MAQRVALTLTNHSCLCRCNFRAEDLDRLFEVARQASVIPFSAPVDDRTCNPNLNPNPNLNHFEVGYRRWCTMITEIHSMTLMIRPWCGLVVHCPHHRSRAYRVCRKLFSIVGGSLEYATKAPDTARPWPRWPGPPTLTLNAGQ